MELNKEKLFEFQNYINQIKLEDRVAVIYDTDMDGISSGIITVKALKKLGKNVVFHRTRSPGSRTITKDLLDSFEEKEINKIIFTDLGIEGYEDSRVLDKYSILVLDHHKRHGIINEKILSIKSFDLQDELEGYQYCVAKLVYDLFSTLTNISDLDWLALAGVIGDMTYKPNKGWSDKIFKKYNLEIKENPFDTKIGELVQYITFAAAIGTQEEFNKLSESFMKSKTFNEVLSNLEHLNEVKNEYERIIDEFETKRELVNEDIYFYQFDSKYYLNSPVCSRLSNEFYPKETIICMQEKDGQINVSARRQDGKYDLGKMLFEVTKKFESGLGGGHPVAAGAKIQLKDVNKFKEEIVNWVGEYE